MIPSRIKPTYLLVNMYLSQNDLLRAQEAFLAYQQNKRGNPTLATFSLEYELFQAFENYKNKNPLRDSLRINNNPIIYR
jgi:hypothetical protein